MKTDNAPIIRQTNAARIHLRHLVTMCKYSRIEITGSTFLDLHDTLPRSIEEAEDGERLKQCTFYNLLQKTKVFRLNPPQQAEIRAATDYVFDRYPRLSREIRDKIRQEICFLLT